MKHLAIAAFGLVLLVGCVDAADDPAMTEDVVSDDTIFFDTVVTVSPDGTTVVNEPRAITAGEQRAQNELRRAIEAGEIAAPIANTVEDTSCAGDSLWLYYRTDWVGPRICFRGAGYAYLGDYTVYILVNGKPFPVQDWQIQSGSFWPGSSSGSLEHRTSPFGGPTPWKKFFAGWGAQDTFFEPSPAMFVFLDSN